MKIHQTVECEHFEETEKYDYKASIQRYETQKSLYL